MELRPFQGGMGPPVLAFSGRDRSIVGTFKCLSGQQTFEKEKK
jgi:hypothetical protein